MELVKYDAARLALQEAMEFDDVKNILDKSVALAAYAKQANDTKIIEWATEIKVRAERKAGEMLLSMEKNKGAATRSTTSTAFKLNEIGVTKYQSSRWQKLASVPQDQFEQAIVAAKQVAGEVTTAAMLRVEKANRPPVAPKVHPIPETPIQNPADYSPKDLELDQLYDSLSALSEENDKLRAHVSANTVPEDAKEEYLNHLNSIIAENHQLSVENKALKDSLNSAMTDIVELKRQCASQRKQIDKLKC